MGLGQSGGEWGGSYRKDSFFFKVNVQMAFKASHSVMESCYLSVVKIHWHTAEKLCDHAISSQNWNCPRIQRF